MSGAGLQHADREMSGEHGLTRIAGQSGVGFGRGLGAIASLFQLEDGIVTGRITDHVFLGLGELCLELTDDGHERW
jgi:hypothetical protein